MHVCIYIYMYMRIYVYTHYTYMCVYTQVYTYIYIYIYIYYACIYVYVYVYIYIYIDIYYAQCHYTYYTVSDTKQHVVTPHTASRYAVSSHDLPYDETLCGTRYTMHGYAVRLHPSPPRYDDNVCSKLFLSQEQNNFRSCPLGLRVICSAKTARTLTTTPKGNDL